MNHRTTTTAAHATVPAAPAEGCTSQLAGAWIEATHAARRINDRARKRDARAALAPPLGWEDGTDALYPY